MFWGMCWWLMFDMRVRIWSCWCVEVLCHWESQCCLCSSKHWLKAPVVQPVLWWVLCFKKCKWLLKLKNRHDYVSIWWEQDVTHEVSLWDSDRECNGGVLVMGQQLMVTLLFKIYRSGALYHISHPKYATLKHSSESLAWPTATNVTVDHKTSRE